ncbi:glycine-rich protein [Conexibacter sp. SYSU D00693]|uniref:glycine-rich protein n=1 Tax=Conexibacter sp. SYSU D00693 TaxID=2812560 RepID=UPI00196A50BE|nr:Ig-like domain-containing protein [Conexibacter sp. SYSU D00693]
MGISRTGSSPHARGLLRRATMVAGAAALALWVTPAAADAAFAPCGERGVFTQSGTTFTCTYTEAGTEGTFVVPSDVTRLDVIAVGAHGGGGFSGRGATVENPSLPVTGGATLYVDVASRGPANGLCPASPTARGEFDGGRSGWNLFSGCPAGNAGGGGGSSALSRDPRASATFTGNAATDSRLLVAGGGGGGVGYSFVRAGDAGVADVVGAGDAFTPNSNLAAPGGVGPTDGTDGGGESRFWTNVGVNGTNGTAASGGDGALHLRDNCQPIAGAGGGGGWFGGGGGPALGCGGAGAGGGGSSYLGADPAQSASIATADDAAAPAVTISYEASRPSATIVAPADGQHFAVGQSVATSFTCAAGTFAVSSCQDSGGETDGTGTLATSTPGTFTYSVTATGQDGLTHTDAITYVVEDQTRPTVSITSPENGASYGRGTTVLADFACADEQGGSGLKSCVGDVADGQPVDTSSLGKKTLSVTATDNAGNTRTVEVGYEVVDATDPTASITTPADGATYARGATVEADFACADEQGGSGLTSCVGTVADGQPIDTSSLGTKQFSVTATDDAGNTRTVTAVYLVADETKPAVSITTPADGATYAQGATVEADFACADEQGGSGLKSCVGTVADGQPIDTSSLGPASFSVTATDEAGNTRTVSAAYTVTDQTPPGVSITSAPNGLTSSRAATIEFGSSDGDVDRFACKLDAGDYATCTPPKSLSDLADGVHVFSVKAIDHAGNETAQPAVVSWLVDATAPDTEISSGPPALTNSTTASIGFGSTATDVARFECQLDGGDYATCTTPKALSDLADGPHVLRVRAVDQAGNVDPSPASRSWTVDTAAPNTVITGGPPALTKSRSASLVFGSSDTDVSRLECKLDGGEYATCTSPKALSGLADGAHTFSVRAVDQAGNADPTPATRSWTVDSAPPETTITSGPTGVFSPPATTNDRTPVFRFTSEAGATFACRVDSGGWSPCTSPFTASRLRDGQHTFSVRATDQTGLVDPSPATKAFTVLPDCSLFQFRFIVRICVLPFYRDNATT